MKTNIQYLLDSVDVNDTETIQKITDVLNEAAKKASEESKKPQKHGELTKYEERVYQIAAGKRIEEARRKAGFSRAEIERSMGFLEGVQTRIESGKRRVSVLEFEKYSRLFDTSVIELQDLHLTVKDLDFLEYLEFKRWKAAKALRLSPALTETA